MLTSRAGNAESNKEVENNREIFSCAINSFDFGTSLGMVYPILSETFKYLEAKDLKNAIKINDRWKLYAGEELRKRRAHGLFNIKKQNGKLYMKTTKNHGLALYGLYFYYTPKYAVKLKKFDYSPELNQCIKGTELESIDQQFLTDDTKILKCYVGSKPNARNTTSQLLGGLFFPAIPNVSIEHYSGITWNFSHFIDEIYDRDYEVRSVLLFTEEDYPDEIAKCIQDIVCRHGSRNFALAGGIISTKCSTTGCERCNKGGVEKIDLPPLMHKNRLRYIHIHCVVFTIKKGTTNFDAYSMVILEDSNSKEDLLMNEDGTSKEYKKNACGLVIECVALRTPRRYPKITRCSKAAGETFVTKYPNLDNNFHTIQVAGEVGWDRYYENNIRDHLHVEPITSVTLKPNCVSPMEVTHAYTRIFNVFTWD